MSECFFGTSKRGGYFFGSVSDFSAYQGWTVFFEDPWELFKVVDRVQGDFDFVVGEKTLLLESSSVQDVVIDLDFRWIHDFSDEGRIYEVYEKEGFLVVKYSKFSDNSLRDKLFSRFSVIRGFDSFNLSKSWVRKEYPFDAERGALSSLFVFRLLSGKASSLSFGFGFTEEDAVVSSLVRPVRDAEKNFSFPRAGQSGQWICVPDCGVRHSR